MESSEDKLYCPHCGSSQLTINKKGFGAGKAAAGAILTGGIGLLAGFIGSGDLKITCLKCGHKCKPGELSTTPIVQKVQHIRPKVESSQVSYETSDFFQTAFIWIIIFGVIVGIIIFIMNNM